MIKYFVNFLLIIQPYLLNSQRLISFELVSDELGGDNGAGILIRVASDSDNIYVLGHLPKIIEGLNKDSHPVIGSVTYDGKIKNAQIIIDTTISTSHFNYSTMIKKNDSVYIGTFYVPNPYSNTRVAYSLFEVDLKNAKILKRNNFYDYSKYINTFTYSDNTLKDSVFQLILETYLDQTKLITSFLYEFDLNLNIKKQFEIKYGYYNTFFRWVSRSKDGAYELILDDRKDFSISNKTQLKYIKVDSFGNVLKEKDFPVNGNFGLFGGESWTIIQNDDGSFVIGCMEYELEGNVEIYKPYLIKTSPEFDSLIWKIKFYPFNKNRVDTRVNINDLVKMKDNSYIMCGDWETPNIMIPDYGLIMKVTGQGDSLWTRKIVPIGWDSLRSLYLTFKQINITPYNTITLVGAVADDVKGWLRPWVVHLDSDGCLVQNCGKTTNSFNWKNSNEKFFQTFPNPVTSDQFYMLSRLSSSEKYNLSLYDLQGKLMHKASFLPYEGTQYILDRPKDIIAGEYILRIEGKEFSQTEKIIFE